MLCPYGKDRFFLAATAEVARLDKSDLREIESLEP
jgi:hypothetical protein